jgi:hypothetical protein
MLVQQMLTMSMYAGKFIFPEGLRQHYDLKLHTKESLGIIPDLQNVDSDYFLFNNNVFIVAIIFILVAMWLVYMLLFGCWIDCEQKVTSGTLRSIVGVAVHWFSMWLPVCGIVQHGMVQLGGDRYTYLPDMALAPLIGALVSHAVQIDATTQIKSTDKSTGTMKKEVSNEIPTSAGRFRVVAWAVRCVIVFALISALSTMLCLESRWLLNTWKSDEHAFKHGLKVDPNDWRILDT